VIFGKAVDEDRERRSERAGEWVRFIFGSLRMNVQKYELARRKGVGKKNKWNESSNAVMPRRYRIL
jgi:hypothetical protein